MNDSINPVFDAIRSRQSIRAFLPTPVAPQVLREILTVASYAPSGNNTQPWQVHVVTGSARDRLTSDLLAAFQKGEPERADYAYYPASWRSPYRERRRETGWGLYETLGIVKGDREASRQQHARNFVCFGAPVVMLFTMDNDLGMGSWLDYGMFLQNIMVAARSCGLHTCPQAALANYPDIIRRHLAIPDTQLVLCGIALGYADTTHKINHYQPKRVPLSEFATFHNGGTPGDAGAKGP